MTPRSKPIIPIHPLLPMEISTGELEISFKQINRIYAGNNYLEDVLITRISNQLDINRNVMSLLSQTEVRLQCDAYSLVNFCYHKIMLCTKLTQQSSWCLVCNVKWHYTYSSFCGFFFHSLSLLINFLQYLHFSLLLVLKTTKMLKCFISRALDY